MKKILSVGLLALVAMATTVFTSCGDDDEESSSSFKFMLYISCMANSNLISATIAENYQQIVGSDAKVDCSPSNPDIIYITCSKTDEEAVSNKLKNASLTALDAALDQLNAASYVGYNIHEGEDVDAKIIKSHEYKMEFSKFLPGTYTATLNDGSAAQIVISAPENGKYPAVVTVGTETYSNTFEITETSDGPTFEFVDKDGKDFLFNCPASIYTSFDHGFDQFTTYVRIGDNRSVGCIFKRQK